MALMPSLLGACHSNVTLVSLIAVAMGFDGAEGNADGSGMRFMTTVESVGAERE